MAALGVHPSPSRLKALIPERPSAHRIVTGPRRKMPWLGLPGAARTVSAGGAVFFLRRCLIALIFPAYSENHRNAADAARPVASIIQRKGQSEALGLLLQRIWE